MPPGSMAYPRSGVDEHCSSHRGIDRWVTVIVDLTNRPARLIDIVPGRSAESLSPTGFNVSLMSSRPALNTSLWTLSPGYKKAATQAVPDAVTVIDPFHVVALVGDQAR